MPQSKTLASETGAMRKVEAAFQYVDQLPEAMRRRVLAWAAAVYLLKFSEDLQPAADETSDK